MKIVPMKAVGAIFSLVVFLIFSFAFCFFLVLSVVFWLRFRPLLGSFYPASLPVFFSSFLLFFLCLSAFPWSARRGAVSKKGFPALSKEKTHCPKRNLTLEDSFACAYPQAWLSRVLRYGYHGKCGFLFLDCGAAFFAQKTHFFIYIDYYRAPHLARNRRPF